MPLDFPTPPVLNQVYSFGGKSWKWNGDAWETYNDNLGVDFVETVNGVTGDVGVIGGTDISVSTAGKILTINYTGSGGGGGGTNVVSSFNGLTGAVQGVSSFNGQTGAVSFHNYVASFNGVTGAVQGVSAINGVTGNFTIRSGAGITHSLSADGITLSTSYVRGGESFPSLIGTSGKALMSSLDVMLMSFKNSGASAGFMYTTRVQDFIEKFVGARTIAPLGEDPSTGSFLMVGGSGTEGTVSFANILGIIDGGTYA